MREGDDVGLFPKGKERKSSYEKICHEVDQIHQEWEYAKRQLDDVTDPDLVDSAIYHLKAVEKRYIFLIKELKAYKSQAM